MIISGLDPSFTSTGAALINTDTKEIKTKAICVGCKDKSFDGIQKSIESIINQLDLFLVDTNKLVMEYPFAGKIFSAGLYGLDSVIYQHFKNIIIKTFHPTTLRKIHGCKYEKKDSITLALKVINFLEDNGYKYINNLNENKKNKLDMFGNKLKRSGQYDISSDESEAFLYTILTCSKLINEFNYKELNLLIHSETICF